MPLFCSHCGQPLHTCPQPCPHCGAQHPKAPHAANCSTPRALWRPLAALTLGLLGLLAALYLRHSPHAHHLDCHIGTLMFSYAATMLGATSAFQQPQGRGLSIAGLVLGILGLVFAL